MEVFTLEITPIIQEDFVDIDENITLSEMIGKLKQYDKRTGLVFRNKKYLGLVERKKLLRANIDPTEVKVAKFVQKAPLIDENADLIETAYLMFQSNCNFLPVEKNKKIVGVISALNLVELALSEIKKLKVKDVKLSKPSKVSKDEPVSRALNVMYKEHIDHVPIYDKGKLYGIITYRDLFRKYLNWSPKRDTSKKFNKDVRTKSARVDSSPFSSLLVQNFSTNDNLISVSNKENLKDAVELMVSNKISDVLVMEGDEFFGVLTAMNILKNIGSLRFPINFNIKFVGLSKLDWHPYEVESLKKICSNEAMKLQRKIKNEFQLTVHLKEYEKEGSKQKYSVHLKVEFPGKILSSSQDDWDWRTAVHKTFENAKSTAEKKFKN